MNEFLFYLMKITIGLIVIKAMIGFHFPWERCECCGKKYREHKKEE